MSRRPLPLAIAAALTLPTLTLTAPPALAEDGPAVTVIIPVTEQGITVTVTPGAAPVAPAGAPAPVTTAPAPQAPAPAAVPTSTTQPAAAPPTVVPVDVAAPTPATGTSSTTTQPNTQAPTQPVPAPTTAEPAPQATTTTTTSAPAPTAEETATAGATSTQTQIPAPAVPVPVPPAADRPAPTSNQGTARRSGMPFKLGLFAHDTPDGTRVNDFEKAIGTKVDILYMAPERDSWDSILGSDWWIKRRSEGGRIPDDFQGTLDVAVPPWPKDGSLQAAATGAYADKWRKLGEMIQAKYPGSQVRIGWEFNISWYYSATPENAEDWKKAWRNAAIELKKTCPTCQTAWVGNMDKGNTLPDPLMAYPGDDVVDLIGVDTYDWDPPYNEQTWPAHRDGEQGWNWWLNLAKQHGKKLTIPEWGITTAGGDNRGGDNPWYIKTIMGWKQANAPWIESSVYFEDDADFHKGSLVHNAPKSAAAMREAVAGMKNGAATGAQPAPAGTAPTAHEQQGTPSNAPAPTATPAPTPKVSETAAPAPIAAQDQTATEAQAYQRAADTGSRAAEWEPASGDHGPIPKRGQ